MGMHGYKVFEPDWTCRGFKYVVGETFAMDEEPIACVRGFHFCERLVDCFNYYSFDPRNKVAEVYAFGTVVTNDNSDNRKYCTNKIKIVKELSWPEVLRLVNIGVGCSGIRNTGAYNVGDGNAGSGNAGNFNTGDYNDGSFNSGNFNAGHYNTGSHNTGNWNTGNFNAGNFNNGCFNQGNLNVGDWNAGDRTSGCFNTEQAPYMMFNKPTTMTDCAWRRSKAYNIMFSCPPAPENRQAWWENLPWAQRASVLDLPNFDADIFRECTGIDVTITGKED